ncbi:endo-1,4-beta-xylanase, putative (macronuclear) [Tetrahymena thermophila SB210]|uniref:Endo-1,4-beta-xylanase, putative n=1 Tax=Tetrahymena thermophila (strain SB210) TaxID=312017 RepID=Q24FE0_TETTS|nr:endo-1,4-beta-xylanase, putative [Tetrahymena thermophila SB210]EAS06518.2 endo-1,4-beta-xylanase, putative [Tetrahymena thermophila SB210]|eukprot:XP_001026763.2 endo-1,4-beta-xylanase, putative [Tetrahymena thermophila SB210]
MSIYSGFSTRKQEYEYNICVDQILSLLSTRTIKHICGEKVDEDKFRKIFKKLFKILQKMEVHKYLNPKFSETLSSLGRVLKIKILDPLKISAKDSKTDLREFGVKSTQQQQNNLVVINNQQQGGNNVNNIHLINTTTRCSSVNKDMPSNSFHQRPMSMEMRSRATYSKRYIPQSQQGILPIKENIKYSNQHQILINNVINVNKQEEDPQQSNLNKLYQPPSTANNQKSSQFNIVSEEKTQVNTSNGELFKENNNKEEDLFTLSQVTNKKYIGQADELGENKENVASSVQKQVQNSKKLNQNSKIDEKQRCKTPPSQHTQQNHLLNLQNHSKNEGLKQISQYESQNNSELQDSDGINKKIKKGRYLKQNNDSLQLRRESQTQAIPKNLEIGVNNYNTPNTVITTGGEYTQKNQIPQQTRKRSSKSIRAQPRLPLSINQNVQVKNQKESDSSKSLQQYESPTKQDLNYNSFYVETSSIKNLKKNLISHQNKQLNNSGKKYAHNQIHILQEISINNSSTQPNSNAKNFQFNDMYSKQMSSKNKQNLSPNSFAQNVRQQNFKNGESNDSSQNSTIQQIIYNPTDKQQQQQQSNIYSSQQSSKEQTINNDSSFKEFLFNSQKQEQSETQFRNRMLVQNLNILKEDIEKQQIQTRSQSLLLQQQNYLLENSAAGLSKLTPQNNTLKNRDAQDNTEPKIIQPTHLYNPFYKQQNAQQSPRFENDTFGLTDNQLSLTPIKQLVKRKKSKKKSGRNQNEKKSSQSFIISTPKITPAIHSKYNYNISPKNLNQVANNEIKL